MAHLPIIIHAQTVHWMPGVPCLRSRSEQQHKVSGAVSPCRWKTCQETGQGHTAHEHQAHDCVTLEAGHYQVGHTATVEEHP